MRRASIDIAALVLCAAAIVWQLFVPPVVGMADSGDFERLLGPHGLAHVSDERIDRYFYYFNRTYRVTAPQPSGPGYLTSTSVLVSTAQLLSRAMGQRATFDVRLVALVHACVLLAGFWLILRAMRSRPLALRLCVAAALLVVFTDVGYVAYFNSFFSEGTAFAFLALAAGAGLMITHGGSTTALYVAVYFLAVAMFVLSKPMYVPVAPALALSGLYLAHHTRTFARHALAGGLAAAVLLAAGWYYKQTPPGLMIDTTYMAVFMDMVPNSPTPEQDLIALGLNPKYAGFAGTTAYQPDTPLRLPEIRAELSQKLTGGVLVRFYLARPGRLVDLCSRGMASAFSTRVDRLGYYEQTAGKPPRSHPFGPWSAIRERVVPRSVLSLAAVYVGGLAAGLLALRRLPDRAAAGLLLYLLMAFIAGLEFMVAIVPAGTPDLEKHLFMFNLGFDACLVLLACAVVSRGTHIYLTPRN